MIKIEFPADRLDIAQALGQALTAIALGAPTERTGTGCADQGCPAHYAEPTEEEVAAASEEFAAMHEQAAVAAEFEPEERATPKGSSLFDASAGGTAGPAAEAGAGLQAAVSSGAAAKLDPKGVPFHSVFCGEAKEPFYASGKAKGQWKKKKGVEQPAYDTWYAEQLAMVAAVEPEVGAADACIAATFGAEPAVDAGSAFQTTQAPAVDAGAAFGATAQVPAGAPVPTDAPSLMVWISERQAAGELTQEQVNNAYAVTKVNMNDLFSENPTPYVATIHTFLTAQLG